MMTDYERPIDWAAIAASEDARVREWVGDALHSAVHPKHPWSGCPNPALVYQQVDRLERYIREHPLAAEAVGSFARKAWDTGRPR